MDERHDYLSDFLAPELAMDLSAPSQASDVWALGCCIFQLVTGCHPFSYRNH
ncbi:hypothetical protein BDZ85DRAFT_256412 [Elsinoe ampelina]|uniref:Protein kinase domain-containing protein n=1 Tax=Elsinoe ampelina TaxID=302913 RepID=A0A6A6GLN4_9PEZI|nr:hypothetical protein BDZ85DRAFT_256412 [Elsinoe ampelina]